MEWRDVRGYEGLYQVSDTGLVKSCERFHNTFVKGTSTSRHQSEKILKPWRRSSYLLVDLWKNGKRDVRSIHVLVYETFKENITEDEVIHHIDFNKFNNNLDNLQKMSYTEHNLLHAKDREPWNKGLHPDKIIYQKMWETRGEPIRERNKQIRALRKEGKSVKELSDMFKICTRSIYDIVNGRTKC